MTKIMTKTMNALRALTVSACALLVACSDGATNAEVPAIASFTASAPAVTVHPGNAELVLLQVRRSSTFKDTVVLSTVQVPAGLNVSFSIPRLDPSAEFSGVNIAAVTTLAAGSYPIVLRASGNGIEPKTVSIMVNVVVPSIALSLANNSVTLEQAAATAIPVTVSRSGNYKGTVTLSLVGLPPGVTGSFSPMQLTDEATTSTLTLTSTLTTATTNSAITVRAGGSGVPEQVATLQLGIVPTTVPAISVSAPTQNFRIVQGESGEITVSVTRYAGYNGPVTLRVADLPDDVQVTAPPIPAGASTGVVRLHVPVSRDAGITYIRLLAEGTGVPAASIPMTLTVLLVPTFQFTFTAPLPTGGNGPVASPTYTIQRGATRFVQGSMSRVSSYPHPVQISMNDVPEGISIVGLAPLVPPTNFANPQSVDFQIVVSPQITPGTYNLRFRGEGGDGQIVERTITVIVQ